MISAGYKSAYQQGYSDAMRDFREKPKTDVVLTKEAFQECYNRWIKPQKGEEEE